MFWESLLPSYCEKEKERNIIMTEWNDTEWNEVNQIDGEWNDVVVNIAALLQHPISSDSEDLKNYDDHETTSRRRCKEIMEDHYIETKPSRSCWSSFLNTCEDFCKWLIDPY